MKEANDVRVVCWPDIGHAPHSFLGYSYAPTPINNPVLSCFSRCLGAKISATGLRIRTWSVTHRLADRIEAL